MKLNEIKIGKEYIWEYTPSGGYGYIRNVNALAYKIGNKKVKIIVYLINGITKEVWVTPEKLLQKNDN